MKSLCEKKLSSIFW